VTASSLAALTDHLEQSEQGKTANHEQKAWNPTSPAPVRIPTRMRTKDTITLTMGAVEAREDIDAALV
jgi:hypothetical protein